MVTNLVIVSVQRAKNKMKKKQKKNDYIKKNFTSICYHCGQKGHRSFKCRERENGYKKENEKAKKTFDGEDDELVLCFHTIDNKKENVKKKG